MGKYLFNEVNSAIMHSSRMRTVRCSDRISCRISFTSMHTPLPYISPCHACPLAHTPTAMHTLCHACPRHTCPLPCMPLCHVHPTTQPCTHLAIHSPCHAYPLPCMPPVDRMTDAYENITFEQLLLRTVKIYLSRDSNGNIICIITIWQCILSHR